MKLNLNKGNIYALVLLLSMFAVYYYRNKNKPSEFLINGETMGTTYSIKYISEKEIVTKSQVDSILIEFNNVFSTYIPKSEISIFNKNTTYKFKSPLFYECLLESKNISNVTNGAFDPTVMPFVNAWGFGFKNLDKVDSTIIDSLKQYVGFDKIIFNKDSVYSTQKGTMLDLSAISKGFGVDIVAKYLAKQGISNMMVEIGGEISCKGKNKEGKNWVIGIDNPGKNRDIIQKIELENKALATSGNYRNFYIKDGKKYAHTINPKTGFPAENSLLSVSVIAENCMKADAYATAFMVLGKEKSIEIASAQKIKILLIYSEKEGKENIFKNF